MSAYTLLQLVEVAIFSAVLVFGVLSDSAPFALLGGGLLIAKNVKPDAGGAIQVHDG